MALQRNFGTGALRPREKEPSIVMHAVPAVYTCPCRPTTRRWSSIDPSYYWPVQLEVLFGKELVAVLNHTSLQALAVTVRRWRSWCIECFVPLLHQQRERLDRLKGQERVHEPFVCVPLLDAVFHGFGF
jgi:hypothetical protein